jgi:Winged helix DNA-binding domain
MTRVSAAKVLGFRMTRHRLDRRALAGSLAEVTRVLCGVHAQLAASAELALWARVEGLGRDDVREALEDERTLVKTWAMRGTLHLLAADDLALYVAVLGPQWDDPGGAWLRGFGVTKEQYEAILVGVPRALGARPKTREQLADKLAELGGPELRERLLSGWGALLKPSARRGDLAFGPNRGRNVTFVRPARWLPKFERITDEEAWVEAQREVVRRFLAAYGPATADDLGRWLGLRAGLKRMLRELETELVEVEVAGSAAWLLAADLDELQGAARPETVRLLPAFDPYVVGFRPRSLLVDAAHEARIFRPQAWFSPVVLVDGRGVGIWERERRGRRLEVRIEPFTRLSAATRRALAEEADRLGEFLDVPAELEVAP